MTVVNLNDSDIHYSDTGSGDESHALPNALVYVDEERESHSLYNNATEVYSGVTGNDPITSVSWDEEEGLMVEVAPVLVRPENYQATINWTVVDGP